MRILVVTTVFPAVSQTFVTHHCAALRSRGHDVTIMAAAGDADCLGGEADDTRQLLEHLVPIVHPEGAWWRRVPDLLQALPRDRRSATLASLMLSDYLRGRTAGWATAAIPYAQALRNDADWDVVHVHFGNVALAVAQLRDAKYLRAPVVATFHGTDLNARRKVANCRLYERVFRTLEYFTVGSRHMADHLVNCGVEDDRFKIMPMGVDLSMFPSGAPRETNNHGPRLATVGRLIECKGTDFAIRAVAELKQRWPNVTLEVIGDGPRRGLLQKLAAELGLSREVIFRGPLPHDQTLRILRESDIYLHPGVVAANGTVEGQGIAVAEASALQLPVVASRVGGIPDMIVEDETGYLVEPRDVAALADQIEKLIEDEALRRQMGAAGRAFIEARFNQQRLMDEWIEIYRRL